MLPASPPRKLFLPVAIGLGVVCALCVGLVGVSAVINPSARRTPTAATSAQQPQSTPTARTAQPTTPPAIPAVPRPTLSEYVKEPQNQSFLITNTTDQPIKLNDWGYTRSARDDGALQVFPESYVLQPGQALRVHTKAGQSSATIYYMGFGTAFAGEVYRDNVELVLCEGPNLPTVRDSPARKAKSGAGAISVKLPIR